MTLVETLYLCGLLVGMAGVLMAVIARSEIRRLRAELSRSQQHAELLQAEESLLARKADMVREEQKLLDHRADLLRHEPEHHEKSVRLSWELSQALRDTVQAVERLGHRLDESFALTERPRSIHSARGEVSDSSEGRLVQMIHGYLAEQGRLISNQTEAMQNEFRALVQSVISEQNRLCRMMPTKDATTSSGASHQRTTQVSVSAFTPATVRRSSTFILDIWVYPSHLFQRVQERATALDRPREVGAREGLLFPLEASITVSVSIPTLLVAEPTDTIYWTGEPANVSYKIHAPEDAKTGSHLGEAELLCDGLKIGKLLFGIIVADAQAVDETRADVTAGLKMIETAFASYATSDRNQVLARLQGIKKVLPNVDVFIDVFTLRSGDNWRAKLEEHVPTKDVFYLFWSRAAAKSEWVEKEWRLALDRRGLDYIDPVPLESPDLAPAPVELADLHFNDAYAAYLTLSRSAQDQGPATGF